MSDTPPVSELSETHDVEAVFDTGEGWKLICECGWEAWGYGTEHAVRSLHGAHILDPAADKPVTVLD